MMGKAGKLPLVFKFLDTFAWESWPSNLSAEVGSTLSNDQPYELLLDLCLHPAFAFKELEPGKLATN
jgi:hypothetical protein